MSKPYYRMCSRCVMDTSDPDIAFDAIGRCNHCRRFLARREFMLSSQTRARLDGVVAEIRELGRSKPFDCVVGVSGGVDSCFLLYVVNSLGLRPLAVHMDNGWDSDVAIQNIKNMVQKLGVEYASAVLEWNEFRDLQLAFLKASVPEIETPTDIAIPAVLHREAAEHGVRSVVLGSSYESEGILPASWHYNAKDLKYMNAIHRQYGSGRLPTFPTFALKDELFYKFVKGIRITYLLHYYSYKRSDAVRLLKDEFGWRDYGGKHHESTFTAFVQSYVLPRKFNIDYRRATLSTQICNGAVTREEALEILAKPPYDASALPAQLEYVAKKFGVEVRELERILDAPAKAFTDYPNNQTFLETAYSVYRKVRAHSAAAV
ncbi:MAG: N-acetyl sugar amidotransferase [Polyangiaceae bacterium]